MYVEEKLSYFSCNTAPQHTRTVRVAYLSYDRYVFAFATTINYYYIYFSASAKLYIVEAFNNRQLLYYLT